MKILIAKILLPLYAVLAVWFGNQLSRYTSVDHAPLQPRAFLLDATSGPFLHGVASGDPLVDAVVIWTRITPADTNNVLVHWEMSTSPQFSPAVRSGSSITGLYRDFTVKVDVSELSPRTTYYYRFRVDDQFSPVGTTKTAGTRPDSSPVRFAIVSCTNYEWGHFNGLGAIAGIPDLDAVIHLGDYIYEYAPGGYSNMEIGRVHSPPYEIISLHDYRARYAQYRTDPSMQAAHAAHPFVLIWDDHEFSNNAYSTGAQNHQAAEGDYEVRKAIAKQAYYEWLPIRETTNDRHYRKLSFGKTVDLILLDERIAGRTRQASSTEDSTFSDASRSMLGAEQLAWFKSELKSSPATWKLIGNQVIFSDFDYRDVMPHRELNFDAWPGYPNERHNIIDFMKEQAISNIVLATGDTHSSWAFEVPSRLDRYVQFDERVAIELGTPSISSSNSDEYIGVDSALVAEQLYLNGGRNPHLKYTNIRDHGYLLVTFSRSKAVAEWWYSETVLEPTLSHTMGKRFIIHSGTNRLTSE